MKNVPEAKSGNHRDDECAAHFETDLMFVLLVVMKVVVDKEGCCFVNEMI